MPGSTVPGAISTGSGAWSPSGRSGLPAHGAVGELGADGTALKRLVHRTIAQVTVELERLHFNKAVALVRELSNAVEAFAPATDGDRALLREALETIVVLLGPDDAASGRGALAGCWATSGCWSRPPGPSRIRPGSSPIR